MRSDKFYIASVCALLIVTAAMTGCANKTEGERTLDRAKQVEDAGNMITRGEAMKRDGAALEARGRAARDQGDNVEGERMINEGQAQQRQGQVLIEQGRKAKM